MGLISFDELQADVLEVRLLAAERRHRKRRHDETLLMDCGAKAYLIKAEFGSERLSTAWDAATADSGTRA